MAITRKSSFRFRMIFVFMTVLWAASLLALSMRSTRRKVVEDTSFEVEEAKASLPPTQNEKTSSMSSSNALELAQSKQALTGSNALEPVQIRQSLSDSTTNQTMAKAADTSATREQHVSKAPPKTFQESCGDRLNKLLDGMPQETPQSGGDCHDSLTGNEDWDVKAYFAAGGNNHRYSMRKKVIAGAKEKYFCIDIGGNIGVDSLQLFGEGFCRSLEIFEIIPDLAKLLRTKFANNPNACISQAGVGQNRSSAWLHKKGANDEATYINNEASSDAQRVEIIRATQYIERLVAEGHENVYILMNCEGCEYAVINSLGAAGLLKHISVLEVQPHKQGLTTFSVEEWRRQHCLYEKYMSATHEKKFGFFLVWDIWVLRG